ncbi:integrase [Ferroglobus placidus]|uniref:integrase n=1 Tax=Ferroglobus placidus TaxID=54261 RepID=UPI0001B770FF|nr:integrase [Ferroglobus placidus]
MNCFCVHAGGVCKKLKRISGFTVATYEKRFAPARWNPREDNPTSALGIRAWFQNFAIEHVAKTEALRFIVGHSPATVGEAHYYNLKRIAKEEYVKLIGKFPISP